MGKPRAGRVGRPWAVAALVVLACAAGPPESGAATRNGFIAMTTVPGGGPIWRIEPAAGRSELLARVGASNLEWSPDGKTLLFDETTSERLVLRAVDPRGRRLRLRLEAAYAPSFAPDGGRIVYQGCGLPICLVTSRTDGSDRRELLRVDPRRCRCAVYEPSWSPRGDRVAYVRQQDRRDGSTTYAIRVRSLDGRDGAVPGEAWCRLQDDPAWSPDGRTLAFVCGDGPEPEIFVVAVNGGPPRKLASGRLPTWSPDGTELAFVRDNADRTRTSLILLRVGTNRRRVVLTRSGIYSIAWQPRRG